MTDLHRHDLKDATWLRLKPHPPGSKGNRGRRGRDNRLFLNAVLWKLRTGAPWRDLPPQYGHWKSLEPLLQLARPRRLARAAGEVLRRDRFGVADDRRQPHQGASSRRRRKRGNQSLARTRGGLNCKLHLAVDAHGLPVRLIVTGGSTVDCSQAAALIKGFSPEALLADKAYDINSLLNWCEAHGSEAVIPPRRHRRLQHAIDRDLYRLRHLIENVILKLKQWRSVATRYAKTTASFLAECQIAALMLWLR